MIVSGMFWFGGCVGNICSPFFYKTSQAPGYHSGIASLLAANIIEVGIFFIFRYAYKWENRKKQRLREELHAHGKDIALNDTAFQDITDKENINFEYVY